jgi:hypothetical protein
MNENSPKSQVKRIMFNDKRHRLASQMCKGCNKLSYALLNNYCRKCRNEQESAYLEELNKMLDYSVLWQESVKTI